METKYVRVPFDVELAKKIQNGKLDGKILTRNGKGARVVCWDKKSDSIYNIVALLDEVVMERILTYTINGSEIAKAESNNDLMLEIPEYMTFKEGDIIAFGYNEDSIAIGIFNRQTSEKSHECYVMRAVYGALVFDAKPLTYKKARFATESEKQKLIDALKSSKEPKSKEYLKRFFGIEMKENKETEFKFRQLVLVRNDTSTKWLPAEFGFDNGDGWIVTIGGLTFRYCIPYEGNENLLGTKEKSVKNDIVKNVNVLTIDEIRKAANKAALVEYDLKLINEAEYQVAKRFFELGTNWFRTLAWKNSNETPETSKLLLVECKDGSISLCKFSKENTDTSKWKRWMYVKNLIPCLEG